MRRIAIINQKGGVGKTTTAVNLGAALARAGQRVVVADLDPQANASLHLGAELGPDEPSTYSVLCGGAPLAGALRATTTAGLTLLPAHIDLSGAELELASAIGRETILRDAVDEWERDAGGSPADFVLFDCPPSLGLLSINGLAAAHEVIVVLQTEFFALQGLSKLMEVLQLLERRLNPELRLAGVLPCLYDSRLRLAREVLAEIRRHFGDQVFKTSIRCNVKLAEAPSHGRTIFEYDPSSTGARDHTQLAGELLGAPQEPGGRAGDPQRTDVGALEERLATLARKPKRGDRTDRTDRTPEEDTGGDRAGAVEAPDPAGADSQGQALGTSSGPPDSLDQVDIPRPAAAQPTPDGLRVHTQADYIGEDAGKIASTRGPWGGRRSPR